MSTFGAVSSSLLILAKALPPKGEWMTFPEDQLTELKHLFGHEIRKVVEAGLPYLLIPLLKLPPGCKPNVADALLCPVPRGDGYESRLYLSVQVQLPNARNWNGNVRICERNWQAVSWKVPKGLTLCQMIAMHLKAFR